MIARLKGKIIEIGEDFCILETSGVGYKVMPPQKCLASLSEGAEVEFRIEHIFREDGQYLYGFESKEEEMCFKLLLGVQGVGAKLAITILSFISPSELLSCIKSSDSGKLKAIQGVGAKLASRLINELKNSKAFQNFLSICSLSYDDAEHKEEGGLYKDATSALVGLGFSSTSASAAVESAMAKATPPIKIDDLIREALNIVSN